MTSKHLSLPLTGNLRDRGTQGRTLWLLVILVANLAVTFGLWFLAFGNIGGFWLAVGYDWRVMISGAVMASQLVSLALWASLCEPRSPFRWLWLALLAAASAAAMAGALVPAAMLARTGSRWGRWALPWGVVVWESYVTFMLVLCAAVVFLLAADIVAWPCRRVLGLRISSRVEPSASPSTRGFGLSELFWWVGMAGAACWLLKAMLDNVPLEKVAVVLVILTCILPASLPAAWAVFGAKKRWLGLVIAIALCVLYSAGLSALFWAITTANRNISQPVLVYVLYMPTEMIFAVAATACATVYANCSALYAAGIRVVASIPARHTSLRGGGR
jgi:hypothetical protein